MGKCTGLVAASAVPDCENPYIKGYTGRALLLQWDESEKWLSHFTFGSINNTLSVENIDTITAKVIAIENLFADPTTRFADAQTASNAEDGVMQFTKTFGFKTMRRGGKFSKEFVDAIAGSTFGFMAIVEKEDKAGDGSYEVVGWNKGLKVNADGVSRQEASAAGTTITMSTVEPLFEIALADGDGETEFSLVRAAFEALWEKAVA